MQSTHCKNHPDRLVVTGKVCKECLRARQKRYNVNYKQTEGLDYPSKKDMEHFIEKKYTNSSIAQVYRVEHCTVLGWLKKYGLKGYNYPVARELKKKDFKEIERAMETDRGGIVIDTDLLLTVRPKYYYKQTL